MPSYTVDTIKESLFSLIAGYTYEAESPTFYLKGHYSISSFILCYKVMRTFSWFDVYDAMSEPAILRR